MGIKTAAKIVLYLVTAVVSLLLTILLVLRSEPVQTWGSRVAAAWLSAKTGADIRIGGFYLSPSRGLQIEDISVKDHQHALLLSAHRLGVVPGRISVGSRILHIRSVTLENGVVQLLTHKGDSVLNLQRILDRLASGEKKAPDTTAGRPWDIRVESVRISGTRFHLQDENEPAAPSGMDYTNIDVSGINLDMAHVHIDGDTIKARINRLAARERSGFTLHDFSGDFAVGPRFLKADGLRFRTDHSDVSLTFAFLYDGWTAYNDFLEKVKIRADIQPSDLDLQDIGFFAPEVAVMKDRFGLSGRITGTVGNFKARDFRFSFGSNTRFYGNISAIGLPNVEETFVDLDIRSLTAAKSDIESLLIPGSMRNIVLPDILANLGTVTLNGSFTGFYNDFLAETRIRTSLGRINADLSVKRGENGRIGYQGRLDAGAFDIGVLTGKRPLLGPVTLSAELNGSGLTMDEISVRMNARIDTIRINNHDFSGVQVRGELADKRFDGQLNIRDPHLGLDFTGVVDLHDSLPDFNFRAAVQHAELFDLNLLARDSTEKLAAKLDVNFKGNSLDNLDGSIRISGLSYQEGEKHLTLNNFTLMTKRQGNGSKSYHLTSDFLDADISGDFSFSSLVPSMTTFIRNYLASFRLKDTVIVAGKSLRNQQMDFEVRFHDSHELSDIFLPFLRIAPGTLLRGAYDEQQESVVLKGSSPAVYVNDIELDNWHMEARSGPSDLNVVTGADRVYLIKAREGDSLEMRVDNLQVISDIGHDTIHFGVKWAADTSRSRFSGYATFRESPVIGLKFNDFNVFLNGRYWSLDPGNYTQFDTSTIHLSDLTFSSGDQRLKVSGNLSDNPGDTLYAGFNRIDVANLDQLFGTADIDIDGVLNGNLKMIHPYRDIAVLADLRVSRFKFNKELLGDALLDLAYNAETKRLDLKSQIAYTGNAGTTIPFLLEGTYLLDKKNPHFDADLTLKNLNLKIIAPFVDDFMGGVSGLASGKAHISGSPERPDIRGQLKLMRTEFRIKYLNVPYSFADIVTIDSNAFIFNKITMYDSLGNKAVLNGKITHHYFRDVNLDLHAEMEDFSAFSNTRAQNRIFYGNARASGSVSITGPPDNIRVMVRAANGGKTHVVIPIDLTRSVEQVDYIIFKEPESDSGRISRAHEAINPAGLSIDLGLRVKEDAEVEVYFPDQLGNLTASGSGNLVMTMTPSTPFTLSGTYTLTKGYFLFHKNLIRLPMSIREGSTIRWTGDVADAGIAISAAYRTKAPLKGVTLNPEQEGIRVPVECIVRLGGRLMNPDISFTINLPNVEEGIRNEIFSAIDTNNKTAVAEQAIYLMVLNQFKPVVNTSKSNVDVGVTSLSLVTNQINTLLSQISSKVNVNMNYKPATSTTQQEFDVGISTQLFNDRLLIDGTFGINSYSASSSVQQSNTFVGDINVEYILTQNRRWRARAFNRTNTLNILNNNAPYTQGVGIKYQRDFSHFGEIFHFGKQE